MVKFGLDESIVKMGGLKGGGCRLSAVRDVSYIDDSCDPDVWSAVGVWFGRKGGKENSREDGGGGGAPFIEMFGQVGPEMRRPEQGGQAAPCPLCTGGLLSAPRNTWLVCITHHGESPSALPRKRQVRGEQSRMY